MDMVKVYDKTGLHVSSFSKRSIPAGVTWSNAVKDINRTGHLIRSQLKGLGVKPHGKATRKKSS